MKRILLSLTTLIVMLFGATDAFAAGRIYYAGDFTSPHVWAWTGTHNVYDEWPGEAMTVLTGQSYYGRSVYYVEIEDNLGNCPDSIIFNNNNNGLQTMNLAVPGYDYMFNGTAWMPFNSEKKWYVLGDFDGGELWNFFELQPSESGPEYSVTLSENSTYSFKVASLIGATQATFSAGTTLTSTTAANVLFGAVEANTSLTTTIEGEYIFRFDTTAKTLTVIFPVEEEIEYAGRIYYAGTYDNPYVWAWSDSTNIYNAFPGKAMHELEGETYYNRPVYYMSLEDHNGLCPDSVIFADGTNGQQTITLAVPGYDYMFNGTAWMPRTTEKKWYVFGDLDGSVIWSYHELQGAENNTMSCTLTLAAGREYYFKISSLNGMSESNLSSGTTLTRTTFAGADFSTDGENAALATTIAGNYTFTFDTVAKTLSVTYPDALSDAQINTTSVPAENGDVLIQAYYWAHVDNDSTPWTPYGAIQWTDLNAEAAELGQYFDLVWLAPSAATADYTGFLPQNYSDQNNIWGTETELRTLISNLHSAGAKVVADIVINHSSAIEGYCSWDPFNFAEYGTFYPNKSWVASDDEMFISAADDRYKRYDVPGYPNGMNAGLREQAGDCGDNPGLYSDENDYTYGESGQQYNWSYAEYNCVYSRDWAHRMREVREMSRAYLTWMKEYIGYDGWRYDFAKGIHASHLDDYNKASNAAFSVAEIFDGDINKEIGVLRDSKFNTYVFDFPAKYQVMNEGIRYGNYYKLLGNASSTMLYNYKKYTVTFVDNHDTFREDYNLCGSPNSISDSAKVIMANAYILAMPGVPCVFYPYWHEYKAQLKQMIEARRTTGVHSESVVQDEAGEGYYKATIFGKNGRIRLLLGPNSGYQYCPEGFTPAYVGSTGVCVGVYYTTEEETAKPVYFLDTQDWGEANAYMWREDNFSNAEWPGEAMTLLGTFDGHKLFTYTHNDEYYSNVIFSHATANDTLQTGNLTLTGHEEKCYAPYTSLDDGSWKEFTELTHTLTLDSAKWTTLYLPLSVSLPDSVYAYYASTFAGDSVMMLEMPDDAIPAYTGVLLLGAVGSHSLNVTNEVLTPVQSLFAGTKQETPKASISDSGLLYTLSGAVTAQTKAPIMTMSDNVPAAQAYLLLENTGAAPQQIRCVFEGSIIPTTLVQHGTESVVIKRIENGQIVIIRDGIKYNVLGIRY